MLILHRKELVLVGVSYWMPDYPSILQDFFWQVEDYIPEIPRVHRFLNYWKTNIVAKISTVKVSTGTRAIFTKGYDDF